MRKFNSPGNVFFLSPSRHCTLEVNYHIQWCVYIVTLQCAVLEVCAVGY